MTGQRTQLSLEHVGKNSLQGQEMHYSYLYSWKYIFNLDEFLAVLNANYSTKIFNFCGIKGRKILNGHNGRKGNEKWLL